MANRLMLALAIAVALVLIAIMATPSFNPENNACTQEAKLCPDGSYVGRVGPYCAFAPCPTSCNCPEGYVQDGDMCNPRCYYSTPKCLIPSFPCSSTCKADSDCVPAQCCHPTSCENRVYKGVCNLLCTEACEGPIDCGAGQCGCVNGRCAVISSV
jgi:hypothetical protein